MPQPTDGVGAADAPYRGHDRRALITPHQRSTGRPFLVAGFGLVLLVALIFFTLLFPERNTWGDLRFVAGGLELSAAALGLVAATLCAVRWRLAGDAQALWIGTAVAVHATFAIAFAELLPRLNVADVAVVGWIRPASLITTVAIFAYALYSPQVDARLTPLRTVGAGFVAVGLLTVLMRLFPVLSTFLASAADDLPNGPTSDTGLSVVALAWAALATVYTLRGLKDQRLLFAWFGLAMFGLTLAELVRTMSTSFGDVMTAGSALVRNFALLFGVIGVTRELQSLFASQSSRLLRTMVDTLDSHATLQAAQARQQELAHEARNALTAIEGATQTLERFRDSLDDSTRQSLALAVSNEIGRLQRLVGAESVKTYRVAFRLMDIVQPQLDLVRAQGAQVLSNLPDSLVAYGRPTHFAEVLQNLLVNARVHGRMPITVRAQSDGEHLHVRVEDRGPGIPGELKRLIFERGRRASDAGGSGLGLYISKRLMVGQDGDLWVEDRPGGGASFVMRLPAGPASMSLQFSDSGRLRLASAQQGNNGSQPPYADRTFARTGTEDPDARATRSVRQPDDPVD